MRSARSVYAKLAFVSLLWAGAVIVARTLASATNPLLVSDWRFLMSTVVLVAALALTASSAALPPTRRQWVGLAFLGLCGVFAYNLLFFAGLKHVQASRASLILSSNPAFIMLGGALIYGDRLTRPKILGIALTISGAVLVTLSRPAAGAAQDASAIGDALIVGACLSWVAFSIAGRRLTQDLGALATVAYAVAIGTAMLFAASVFALPEAIRQTQALSWQDWMAIAYLGIFASGLAFVWYYDGLARLGAAEASAFTLLTPILTLLLAAAVLHERLNLASWIGAALTLSGIYLVNRPAPYPKPGL